MNDILARLAILRECAIAEFDLTVIDDAMEEIVDLQNEVNLPAKITPAAWLYVNEKAWGDMGEITRLVNLHRLPSYCALGWKETPLYTNDIQP